MKKHSGLFRHLLLLTLLILYGPSLRAEFNIEKTVLDNGLKVLLLEDHHAPLAAIEIAYCVGTSDEPRGFTGVTRICEKIAASGTERFDKDTYVRTIQAGGGQHYSNSDRDFTWFQAKIPIALLDTVLTMEADRMENVNITYEKLLLAREEVRKTRKIEHEGSLYGPLNEELFALQFRSHPYTNPLYGWPPDLENITTEMAKEYYRKYFVPANACIVLAGDFDKAVVKNKIDSLFGRLISPPPPERVKIIEPEHSGERRSIIYDRSQVPVIATSYLIPEKAREDLPELTVMNQILSQGESSRLWHRLVSREELAMATGGGLAVMKGPGLLYLWAMANFDVTIPELEETIKREVNRLKKEKVSAGELAKAKNQLRADHYRSLQGLEKLVGLIAYHELVFGDFNHFEKNLKASEQVTAEEIKAAARKYLVPENRASIIMEDYRPAEYRYDRNEEAD